MHKTSRRYALLSVCVIIMFSGSMSLAQTSATARYMRLRDSSIDELKAPYEALVAQYQSLETTQTMDVSEAYWKANSTSLYPTLSDCDHQWQALWDSGKVDDAASAFNECYARGVTSTPSYRSVVAQAQELVSRLAH
jgi:hypothetical protein